jgi:hypothetical protein
MVLFVVYAWGFNREGADGIWPRTIARASLRMQAGQPIHHLEAGAYTYPPLMALLAAPLANLPRPADMAAWYLVNVLASAVAFWCAWRMIGGPRLIGLSRHWSMILLVTAVLVGRYFVVPLESQQFDMLVAAAALAGCLMLARGRDTAAGGWLGLATALKCTPLLFAPYLLWRGKWKAAALLVGLSIGLNLLPDLVFPQVARRSYAADFVGTFVSHAAKAVPGQAQSHVRLNQSLAGLIHRWHLAGVVDPTARNFPKPTIEQRPRIRVMTYAAILGCLAVTAWRFGRPGRVAESLSTSRDSPWITCVEVSAVLCLMLMFSPMTSKSHFAVLVLPTLLLAQRLIERRERAMWALAALLLVTGPLSTRDLIGRAWCDTTLFWGWPTWHVIGTWCGMLWLRGRGTAPAVIERADTMSRAA